MAIPVARVHLAMAHAALPALLPTPPKSKMLPMPPCILILPMSPPKPSRAVVDADDKWDARKNATKSPPKPCRADAVARWDAHKTVVKPASPASSSGSSGQRTPAGKSTGSTPRRASSCERWNSNKKSATSSSSSTTMASSSSSASRASSGDKWDSNKRRPRTGTGSRASSAGRWDAHKKPRGDGIDDDGQSSTGSNDMDDMPQRAFYAGPGFLLAAPEPSMLPMPSSFMLRVAA